MNNTAQLMLDFDSTVFRLLCSMGTVPNGERVCYEDTLTWDHLPELCGPADSDLTHEERIQIMLDVFDEAMKLETMLALGDQALFDGVADQVRNLHTSGILIHVVTDRPEARMRCTEAFLDEHAIPFDSIHRVSSREKAAWCLDNGVSVMVDDKPNTIESGLEAGLSVFSIEHLFNRHLSGTGVSLHKTWSTLGPDVARSIANQ